MNYTVLPGRLLVVRDPEEPLELRRFGDVPIRLYAPDDTGANTWAATDRVRSSGTCLLHIPGGRWVNDPDLSGLRVWWEKYAESAFEVEGRTFHVIPERAVYAYEEGSDDEG